MAKPPWARLTKPIKPMVTERPTDTMNSTMPAATPPRSMLATSTPKITSVEERPGSPGARRALGGLGGARSPPSQSSTRAGPDLLLLAGVLDLVDLADHLLDDAPVLHDRLGQVLVHHDIAGDRVDRDGATRARELPPLQRFQRLLGIDLPFQRLDHVDDRRHAVVAADGHEVGRGGGTIFLLPRFDEPLV